MIFAKTSIMVNLGEISSSYGGEYEDDFSGMLRHMVW
jgi:hypothetical protein